MKFESENIEYKSILVDDICKSVIAFANTSGRIIYVGYYVRQGASPVQVPP